jgi:hypothetical protein
MKKPASRRHGKRVSEASCNQQFTWELLNSANARLLARVLGQLKTPLAYSTFQPNCWNCLRSAQPTISRAHQLPLIEV